MKQLSRRDDILNVFELTVIIEKDVPGELSPVQEEVVMFALSQNEVEAQHLYTKFVHKKKIRIMEFVTTIFKGKDRSYLYGHTSRPGIVEHICYGDKKCTTPA